MTAIVMIREMCAAKSTWCAVRRPWPGGYLAGKLGPKFNQPISMKTVITILEITAGLAVFNLLLAVAVTMFQVFYRERRETRKRTTELSQQ
jgi:hypothetical protein